MALTVEHWKLIADNDQLVDTWEYVGSDPGDWDALPDDLRTWLFDPGLWYVVESSLSYGDSDDFTLRWFTGQDTWDPARDITVHANDFIGKRLDTGEVFIPNPALYEPA